MEAKQTPEQAAIEAMRTYASWLDAEARQTIIKAFQDRAAILEALDSLAMALAENPPVNKITVEAIASALVAISKAKEA